MTTSLPPSVYRDRRAAFMNQMTGGVAVIPASSAVRRGRTLTYPYQADGDFYWLTGLREPDAVLVLTPDHPDHQTALFIAPQDPAREVWEGRRLGVHDALEQLGVDAAFSLDRLGELLTRWLGGMRQLYYAWGALPEHDALLSKLWSRLGSRALPAPTALIAPGRIAHELRLRKSAAELAFMRRSAAITAGAFTEARRWVRPGGKEYEVEGVLIGAFRRQGAEGPAYNPIVAAGAHATTLHYERNDGPLSAGELLLIDAGAQVGGYACDVSRTLPIDGRFSAPQRALYDVVLAAQEAAIARLRPGMSVQAFHLAAVEVLTEGLVALGVLRGASADLIAQEAYRPYYPHSTGHWLGLDTHDVGEYQPDGVWRTLEPGMVLTVEPGLYFPTGAGTAFDGIGLRLEDDVVVTTDGPEVLTAAIPRTIADIESFGTEGPPL